MEKPFKLVLLGEGRVGKTSLLLRYVQNTYSDKQQSTIQASFLTKKLNLSDRRISLAIWDTAGQEKFHALGPIYYRDADAALLVYDITDQASFTKVKNWVKELRQMVGHDIHLAIAGNKSDLERHRQVSVQEAEQYASSVGAKHFSTSAKQAKGVDDAFLYLAKKLLASNTSTTSTSSTSAAAANKQKRNTISIISDEEVKRNNNEGCSC